MSKLLPHDHLAYKTYRGEGIEVDEPALHEDPCLSAREVQMVYLVSLDNTAKEIADFFGLSEATVHTHIKAVMRKMGVHTRAGAAAKALRMGLIE